MADLLAAYHFGQCAAISSLETAGSERRRSASAIAQSVSPSLTTCSRGASSTGSVAREPLVGSRVATPPGSAGGAPHPSSTSAAELREVVSAEAGESAGASVPGGGGPGAASAGEPNAITETVDHVATLRNTGAPNRPRKRSSWRGAAPRRRSPPARHAPRAVRKYHPATSAPAMRMRSAAIRVRSSSEVPGAPRAVMLRRSPQPRAKDAAAAGAETPTFLILFSRLRSVRDSSYRLVLLERPGRSEERRVGKERRSRWGRDHQRDTRRM